MTEYAIDIDIHFLFSEELNEFHVAVSNRIHQRAPVVGSKELIDEVGKGIEEIYYLLCLSSLYITSSLPIQQNILLTYGCLVTWL